MVLQFTWYQWIYSVMTGVLGVAQEVMRFKAMQNQKAAKLQKLQFLATLYSFLFDLLIFHD